MTRPHFYTLNSETHAIHANPDCWPDLRGVWPFIRVAETWLGPPTDGRPGAVYVSTVFLGIDIQVAGPPVLFETMTFGGAYDRAQRKHSATWDAAIAEHERHVRLAKERL